MSNFNFGSGGFGQQQQQQPQQSAFGGGTFGGGGGFGSASTSTPAFGAPAASPFGQPAQQPQAGAFGSAFGAPQQQQQPATSNLFGSSTPAFGAPQQTQGSNLFGSAAPAASGSNFTFGTAQNAQTGGGMFGNAASSTPAFGAPKPAFGGGGTMFGGGNTGSAFGGGTFGTVQAQPPQPGTAHTPWSAHAVQDPKDGPNGALPQKQMFQSISAMDEYNKYSVEELRVQDYAANRKHATPGAQQPQFGGFGSTSQAGTSVFGGATTAPPAYSFGNPAPANTGGGLFGSQPATTSSFGAATSAPNLFGAAPAATPANPFGGATTNAFGAPKAPFNFGGAGTSAAPAQGGLFGGVSAAPAAPSAFGQPATSAFGATPAQAAPAPPYNFGLGAAKPATPGLFGAPASQAPGTNLFGGATQQPAAAKPTFGGFGQPQQQQPAAGGLFGSGTSQAPAFGSTPASGSLFGNSLGGSANTGGGLFGAKPAAAPSIGGGFFGSASVPPAGGLFNSQPQQQSQQQQPLGGSSMFGGQNSTSAPSFFGGNFSTASQPAQQQPQQSAYALADAADAYGSNPLFANVNFPSPATTNPLNDKKKPPIFTAFRGTPVNRSSTKITRLRGFGTPVGSPSTSGGGRSGSPLLFGQGGKGSPLVFTASTSTTPATPGSGGRASPLRLVNGIGDDVALSPNAFVSRPSVKKLVIGRKAPGEDGASPAKDNSSTTTTSGSRPRVTFNPEVEVPSGGRHHFQSSLLNQRDEEEHVTPSKKGSVGGTGSVLGGSGGADESSFEAAPTRRPARPLKHGDYSTTPSIEHLQSFPASALQSVSNLEVRREGYGRIHFNAPVDLTTLASVEDLCGGIVQFDDRNCTVYPAEIDPKPRRGRGLNVPATITLERCWPVDKSTRQPIKEEGHPRLAQHIKRLKNLEDTEFEEFKPETGEWRFSVQGF